MLNGSLGHGCPLILSYICRLKSCATQQPRLSCILSYTWLNTLAPQPSEHWALLQCFQKLRPTSILPVSGWNPLAGSSVVTLHWMAQPFTRILSCLRLSSGRLRPSQTCSWACTRSTLSNERGGNGEKLVLALPRRKRIKKHLFSSKSL